MELINLLDNEEQMELSTARRLHLTSTAALNFESSDCNYHFEAFF